MTLTFAFRYLLLMTLLLPLAALAADAKALVPDDSLLAAYVSEAWETHPDLAAMNAMITAQQNRTRMNSAWMNPQVSFGLMNTPQSFDTHMDPNTMWQIGVMQEFPLPGKLSASRQAGALRTSAAVASLDEGRYRMAAMVAMAYYDLGASLKLKALLRGGQQLATQMGEAAGAMVSANMGSQADVLRARVEFENWQVKITNNDAEVTRKRAALAYAVGRSDTATLTDPALPDSLPPLIDISAALADSSVERTAALARAQLESGAARADVRRARMDYWPNPTVGVTYGLRGYVRSVTTNEMTGVTTTERMQQDPMISIELSAPLPLFFKGNQQARVDELRAMQQQKDAELKRTRLEKQQELRDLAARWKQSVDCCRIEEGKLLPQVQETWRALLNDYRAGKATFMSLSQAQMNVVMAEMDVVMHKADGWAIYREWQAAQGKGSGDAAEK